MKRDGRARARGGDGLARAQGARRIAACHEALLLANTFSIRIIGSTVLALSWLAAGRAADGATRPWMFVALATGAVSGRRRGHSEAEAHHARRSGAGQRRLCSRLVDFDNLDLTSFLVDSYRERRAPEACSLRAARTCSAMSLA